MPRSPTLEAAVAENHQRYIVENEDRWWAIEYNGITIGRMAGSRIDALGRLREDFADAYARCNGVIVVSADLGQRRYQCTPKHCGVTDPGFTTFAALPFATEEPEEEHGE